MPKNLPRSPYNTLGGLVHLPRLIDKARLHRRGTLVGYNYKTVGFDKHLLAFLQVDAEAFEAAANACGTDDEVLQWIQQNGRMPSAAQITEWNRAMITRRPDTPEKLARFQLFLKEAGGEGRNDVQTYFDLIELDEGRLGRSDRGRQPEQ